MKIDAHNHPDWYGYTYERFIENMDQNGIDICWLLSWECPESEYNPEDDAVMPPKTEGAGPIPFTLSLEYMQRSPQRFVAGYAPDPRLPGAAERLKHAVREYGVRVCGEVKLRMLYDNPDAIEMFRYCGEAGLPVVLHFDYASAARAREGSLRPNWWFGGGIDNLERLLDACPETNFCGHAPGFWSHISNDTLHLTESYPAAPVVPGGRIEQLLEKYDNLFCDISAGSGCNALSRDLDYSRRLITKHPTRFLYARDRFDSIHDELIDKLQLPTDCKERLFSKNALSLIKT